eukprot:GHUV01030812.1.p1 GENE.GHUV01030812.1~~GHUV01030812.1.p1  ORF type:complete len:313 (+),score=111.82 GHUV01030812.1:70-1008(+)
MARVCQHAASPNSAACCSRHRVRCRASILHNPQQRVSPQQQGPIQLLRDWITANGGYIHPALQLVDNARVSGCRGIIAAQAITLDELEWGPLISVPQSLQLTSRHALELIGSLSNSKDIVSAVQQQLTDGQLVAAALAYHCKQLQQETSSLPQVPSYSSSCSSSFWWPYISNLPPRPQNPWLVQNPDQIAAAIRPYASSRGTAAVAGWAKAVADYRQQMLDSAAAVEQLLGGLLAVTVDDMMTATGHLQSRSLTSSGSSGLVPFVDLLNHGAKARAPMLQLDDNDKLVVTVLPIYNVSTMLSATSTADSRNI